MTDQHTSLSLAALQEIVASIDHSIAVFDRAGTKLSYPDMKVREMLGKLRSQLAAQIAHHPDSQS